MVGNEDTAITIVFFVYLMGTLNGDLMFFLADW